MTVLIALLVVGAGSLAFRIGPLLGARRLPDRAPRIAGRAGLAVLAAITVRAVVDHHDPAVPAGPLLAAPAVGIGLYLAYRGRSVPLAVAAGIAAYLVLSAAVAALI